MSEIISSKFLTLRKRGKFFQFALFVPTEETIIYGVIINCAIRRIVEKRDRNIAEMNYDYVTRFSIVTVLVVIASGAIQIYLIRSLFEEKSVFKKVLRSFD